MTETLDRSRAPAPGPARELPFPEFERRRAAAGLETIVAPLDDTELVALRLVTRGGAQHDPDERPGLAAFLGAILDQGIEGSSAYEIACRSEHLGASLSVSVDWDVLTLTVEGLARDLEALLELLADVALRPTLPEAEIERIRGRKLAEIARRRTVPSIVASERFAREVYGAHPYGHPVIGTEESLRALDRDDLDLFYRERVRTGGAALVAAGHVDAASLHRAVEERFAGWSEHSAPADPEARPPVPEGPRVVLVDRPGAPQTELRVGHASVPRNHPDRTPLVVLSSLLGGKFTSRLNLALREKHGITYGIRSRFSARRGPAPFLVSSSVATSGVGLARRTILDELRRLREEPVAPEELEDTRRYLIGVFPYTLQTASDVAERLAQLPTHDLPADHWDRYRERLEAVDVETLHRVAREHLHPDRTVTVAVGPEADLESQLPE